MAEFEVADLAPIPLQILARQTFEANRHVGHGLLVFQHEPFVARHPAICFRHRSTTDTRVRWAGR
jgi:hypothetical protein